MYQQLMSTKIFFKILFDMDDLYGRMIEVTGLITTKEKRIDYAEVYVCC